MSRQLNDAQRAFLRQLRPGLVYRLPIAKDPESKARRAFIVRLIDRGLVDAVRDDHYRRARRAYAPLPCKRARE